MTDDEEDNKFFVKFRQRLRVASSGTFQIQYDSTSKCDQSVRWNKFLKPECLTLLPLSPFFHCFIWFGNYLFSFYGTLTLVGYLMPNPFYTYTLFGLIW